MIKSNSNDMKYIDLIQYLINPKQLGNIYQIPNEDSKSEALLIYMKDQLDLESEIAIFSIEETDDDILFMKEGERYIQFFPVDHAVDLVESDLDLKNKGYSDLEIAKRLLEYRINDA